MAKRVNKKFLLGLTIAVVGLALALVVVVFITKHRNPAPFIAAAEKATAEGRYEDAAINYRKAMSLDRGNAELRVKFGDTLNHLVSVDSQSLGGARGAWQNALSMDPQNKAAMRDLMQSYNDELEGSGPHPNPAVFANLREIALKLGKVDPSDFQAQANVSLATVRQYLAGISTTPRALGESIDALQGLMKKDPANADLLFYVAAAKLRRAGEAARGGQPEVLDKAVTDVSAMVESAVKAQPDNPSLLWRAAAVYGTLSTMDAKNADAYLKQASASADRAHDRVKPEDPNYGEIQAIAVSSALHAKDTKRAEAIYREYYRQRPNDPMAILGLGRYLATLPGKQDEAIQILAKPISATGLEGFKAYAARNAEAERLYHLSMLRVQSYAATTDPARRKLILDDLLDNQKRFNELSGGESLGQLRLKAKIHDIKGEYIEAMASYQRALNLMERNGIKEWDTINDAAGLDMRMGQTGSAVKLLTQIVDFNPSYAPARFYLADLYLRQDNPDEAQRHLDALEKLTPDSPELARMRVMQYSMQKKPEAAKAVYDKLPETKLQERLVKAQIALQMKDYPEGIRLLETARKEAPDNVAAMLALAQSYAARGQKDSAKAVIADALKTSPNDRRLLILQKQLDNATPAELEKLNEQLIAGADEFTREVQEYQLALSHGKADEAIKHLQAADKLKPGDKLIAQLYFEFYLGQKNFDLAQKQIPTLVKLKADESDGWMSRTRLAMARGDGDEAVKAAKQVVSLHPEFALSYVMLGQAYALDDQFQNAVREFRNALDRQSSNFDALRGLVEAYSSLKQPEEAAKAIAQGRKLYPDSFQFREYALNYDLFYSSHPETVIEERTKLLKANPDQIGSHLALAQADLRLAELRAAADPDASKKYAADAQAVLSKAVTRWPGDIRVVATLAQTLQYLVQSAEGEKLLQGLAAQPEWKDKPEPDRLLADFYLRAGNLPAAEKALRSAYERSNHAVDLELGLAALLARQSKFDEAARVLADNPTEPRVVKQRVQTLVAARKFDDAERTVKAAIAAAPNSADMLNLLTAVYLDAARLEDARVAARNALKVDRNNDVALYQQAKTESLMEDADLELALRDLRTVKEHNPASIPARLVLAQVLDRRGQHDDAIRELEDAHQASPLHRDTSLALLNAYASARPARWDQFDRFLAAAEADPRLRDDPTWLQKDSAGLAARKQYPQAVQKIRAAMKLAPENSTLNYDFLGILLASQDNQAVLQETDKLLAAGKKDWWIYFASGMAKAGAGDKAGGLADLDKSIAVADAADNGAAVTQVLTEMASKVDFNEALHRSELRSKETGTWRLFVLQLYRRKGDWANAIKTADQINADPGSNLTRQQKLVIAEALANGYQSLNQPEKSRQAYGSWIELAPSNPIPLNNLAYLLAETMHQPTEAKVYSQKAYQLAQQSGADVNSIRDTHGWILTLCGGRDAVAGLKLLRQAVDENQNFIEARYHLAEAYLRGSQADNAEEEIKAASALAKAIEAGHGQVSPEIKAGIREALEKLKQLRSAKSDAAASH